MGRRIPENTEQVFAAHIGYFTAQVVKVGEELNHKIFVYDVVPVFGFSGRTVGQRLESKEITSLTCSSPDQAIYFFQPELDWSNFSVAINQGVITGTPFYRK